MANIRATAVATTVLSAAIAAATASAAVNTRSISATQYVAPQITVTAFVVPSKTLENQTVLMSDFRAFRIDQVSIDVATATDDVAITTEVVLTDSVTATDVINRMFYGNIDFDPSDPDADPDPINVVDTDAKDLGKTLTDASAVTETDVKSVGKVADDVATATETINTKDVGKSLTDAVITNDAINTFDTAKVVADSATIADTNAKELTRPDVADYVLTADDSSRQPGLGKTDTVTATDAVNSFDIGTNPNDAVTAVDSPAFVVAQVLTDSVTMTDFVAKTPAYEFDFDTVDADADPDPVTVTEVMAKSITRPNLVDTATAVDAINTLAISKALSDTATVSDVINLLLVLGQSSPLYDFIGMSDDKFYYSPIGGVLNAHLIHQPLVNGEFVLTIDPNAGIVYTIRTESASYMYAGYGLNENQLN